MSTKQAKGNTQVQRVNNLLILIIIILAFIVAYGFIRKASVSSAEQQEDVLIEENVESGDDEILLNGDDEDDNEILQQRFKQFILDNPELILESVTAYQNRQVKERDQARNADLDKHYDDLVAHLPYVGPKNAKNEVVEFYDYNCGYCKRAVSVINKVIAENPDTKVYLADFPILGPSSDILADVSVAAYMLKPEKFLSAHNILIKQNRASRQKAVDSLVALGFDSETLMRKSKSKEVQEFIAKTQDFAKKLSISGTPAFIVNKTFFGGAIGYEVIQEELRK